MTLSNLYMERRKVKNGEKSPWGQCLTRPVPNRRRRFGFWLVPEKHKFSGTNQKPERRRPFGTGLVRQWARSIQPKFPEISVQNSMDRFDPTGKVSKKRVHLLRWSTFPGRTGWKFGWMDRAHFPRGSSLSVLYFSSFHIYFSSRLDFPSPLYLPLGLRGWRHAVKRQTYQIFAFNFTRRFSILETQHLNLFLLR